MNEKDKSLREETVNRSLSPQDAKVLPNYVWTDKELCLLREDPDILKWYWDTYQQEALEFLDVLMGR